MASCKDCIHSENCASHLKAVRGIYGAVMSISGREVNHLESALSEISITIGQICYDNCDHFQDRSRFVELPCKVYTTFIGRVVEAKIYGYEASMKNSNCSWTIEPQHFGKYVFFTQEAAEQSLKERESNA